MKTKDLRKLANIVDINELRNFLYGDSPVHFSYRKADGEIREALGTLNPSLIPENFKPKDSSRNFGSNLKYFDLEKGAWRSLQMDASIVWV